MNEAALLRRKLMFPPNAVPDTGIDLKRRKGIPVEKKRLEIVPRAPSIIGRWYTEMSVIYISTKPPLLIRDVQRAVCDHYRVLHPDLISPRREASIVRVRHIAMYLCRVLTAASLPMIARHFGNRDHTTVMHACRRIEAARKDDELLNAQLNQIIKSLT